MLLASHNLSKAAFGALQKNDSQLHILHYELGVLTTAATERVYRQSEQWGFTAWPYQPAQGAAALGLLLLISLPSRCAVSRQTAVGTTAATSHATHVKSVHPSCELPVLLCHQRQADVNVAALRRTCGSQQASASASISSTIG